MREAIIGAALAIGEVSLFHDIGDSSPSLFKNVTLKVYVPV